MLGLYIIMPVIGPQQQTRRDPEHPGEVRAYLSRLYGEERRGYACRAENAAEFRTWQRPARPKLVELLGLERIAESAGQGGASVVLDPNAEQLDGYTRGTGRIQTEPDVWVRFWILKPDGAGPVPLALTPHGHENDDEYAGVWDTVRTREKIERTNQDVAVQAAKRGFLAIAPATRGMGANPSSYRIRDIADRVGRDCRCHALQVALGGRTMIGERVWDLMRLIDWASGLPEVADGRVLMLGNSGGGMATLHAAACDERIGVAVPCCAFDNYISPRGTMRHCPGNAVPGMLTFGEYWDVAGLIAPRSLLTVNGLRRVPASRPLRDCRVVATATSTGTDRRVTGSIAPSVEDPAVQEVVAEPAPWVERSRGVAEALHGRSVDLLQVLPRIREQLAPVRPCAVRRERLFEQRQHRPHRLPVVAP